MTQTAQTKPRRFAPKRLAKYGAYFLAADVALTGIAAVVVAR